MPRDAIETLVRAIYKARLGNDLEAARSYFSDDSRFTLNGCPQSSPIAMSLCGKEEVGGLLTQLFETWKWLEQDIHHILIDGERVAVHYRLKARFVPGNEVISTQICDLLTLKSGQLTEIIQFLDTALVTRVLKQCAGGPSANAA